MNSQLTTHITPILAITGYINYPKDLRINPTLLYTLSVTHNVLLVAFSSCTGFGSVTIGTSVTSIVFTPSPPLVPFFGKANVSIVYP